MAAEARRRGRPPGLTGTAREQLPGPRVAPEVKQRFLALCAAQDVRPSHVLRSYVEGLSKKGRIP
jgi:hypothetical protein